MAIKPTFALPVAAGPSASSGALNKELNRVVSEAWDEQKRDAAAIRSEIDAAAKALDRRVDHVIASGLIVGEWSATSGAFPTARPDGTAIRAGDTWRVSVAGTLSGQAFAEGDYIQAIRAGGGAAFSGNWAKAALGEMGSLRTATAAAANRAETFGARTFDSVTALVSDTSLTAANTPLGTSVEVRSVGCYKRVATGGDIVTAGGVRLEIERDARGFFPAALLPSRDIADLPNRAFDGPILLRGDWTMSASRSVSNLHLIGAGGKITGYDGEGFRLTGGSGILDGDLEITGFEDGSIASGPGGEHNKTNYPAGFCRIAPGSLIKLIDIRGGRLRATNSRALITAGSETSDVLADPTIIIERVNIERLYTDGVMQVANLRCVVGEATGGGNHFRRCVGAARVVCGIAIYLDGLPAGDPAYEMQGSRHFSADVMHTLVNRTTTGDSTTGNNYETHAYMLTGRGVFITDPTVTDCTGTAYDCEAIYTKAVDVIIRGGKLLNAGSQEGAVTCKGNALSANLDAQAQGARHHIIGTTVEFTRYSYDNDGTVVNFTDLRAATVAAAEDVDIDITAIGCKSTAADVRIDAYLANTATVPPVTRRLRLRVKSVASRSRAALVLWGAFWDVDADVRAHDIVARAGSWATILAVSVAGRGTSNKRWSLHTETVMRDTSVSMSGQSISGVDYDSQNFDIDGLEMTGLWDVVGPAAEMRPMSFTRQNASGAGKVDNINVHDWQFLSPLTPEIGPIRCGSAVIHSGRIDLHYPATTDSNTTVTGSFVDIPQGVYMRAGIDALAVNKDDDDAVYQPPRHYLFKGGATTAETIGSPSSAAVIGSITSGDVGCFLSVSSYPYRVAWRLNGEADQVWDWRVHMTAEFV